MLDRELEVAKNVARRCGKIALAIQDGGDETLQTTDKADDQGPVTRADLAVEAAIVATLREHFPDDAILAEESAAKADWLDRERVWMIDPVDGTRDFANGDPSWAIHIGLCIGGRPVLGVVHEPGHGRTTWGVDYRDQHAATTDVSRPDGSEIVEILEAVRLHDPLYSLVTSKSHRSERLDAVMERLEITPTQTLRTASTGVKISMVARGAAAIYAHPTHGTKLWDSCAPQAILHAAGGRLTDMRGEPLAYAGPAVANERGLLATGPKVDHEALVASLRPLVDEWFPLSSR